MVATPLNVPATLSIPLAPTDAVVLTAPVAPSIPAAHRAAARQEAAHVFGRCGNLVGISVHPQECSAQQDLCVIMLTAGMLHHVGPYGLHVELAQRLAMQGFASLRFDLSGIGESLAVGSADDSLSRAVDETRQAMDFLYEQYGFERFILFGLCSGADDAIQVARMDARVRGAVLMDGCGFRTPRYYWHRLVDHYLPKLMSVEKVIGKIRDLLHVGRRSASPASLAPGQDIREFPDRAIAQSQIQWLVDGGTSLLFLYTGGARDYFNHRAQFVAMFPDLRPRGRTTVLFRPQWDHVAYLPEDRQALIDEVTAWTQANFAR